MPFEPRILPSPPGEIAGGCSESVPRATATRRALAAVAQSSSRAAAKAACDAAEPSPIAADDPNLSIVPFEPRGDTLPGDLPRGHVECGDAPCGDAPRGDAPRGDAVRGETSPRRTAKAVPMVDGGADDPQQPGDGDDSHLPAPLAQLGEALAGQARFLSACYPPQWDQARFQQRLAGRQQAQRARRRIAALAALAASLVVLLLAWTAWRVGTLPPAPHGAQQANGSRTASPSAPPVDVSAAGASVVAHAAQRPAAAQAQPSPIELARQARQAAALAAPDPGSLGSEPLVGGEILSGLLSVPPAVDHLSGAEVFGLSGLETPGKRGGF